MTPFIAIHSQGQLHEDRVAHLRASMNRPSVFTPRRTLGAWLVSLGLRLAPEERTLRFGTARHETAPCSEPL